MKVWCLLRDQFAHVKPVEIAWGNEAQFIYDEEWVPDSMLRARPDIVLCVNDYHFDVARCLDAARENRIPSLILQDGILEWRCQFENPLFGAGGGAPQHQPVIADKIACIGQNSLRRIAAWGNSEKVELSGMPRLDVLSGRRCRPPLSPGKRILVITAKNPGFTPSQREITLKSLHELKTELASTPQVEISWRVSKSIGNALGIENELKQIGSIELANAIEQADAVISTPSTAMLEAMLMGRPVAALDYHNVPRLMPTAWCISARSHVREVVHEILNPPGAKMAYQQEILADSLVCDGSAAVRVRELMEQMVALMKADRPLPADILGGQKLQLAFHPFPLRELYPEISAFSEQDMDALRCRLARAESENQQLKAELLALKQGTQIGATIARGLRFMRERITGLRSGQ